MTGISRNRWKEHTVGTLLLSCALVILGSLPMLPARSATDIGLEAFDQIDANVVIAFAGYPGCTTVCPTALATMSNTRRRLNQEDVALAFINIDRTATYEETKSYTDMFAADFDVFTVSDIPAEELSDALGLRTYEDTTQQPIHKGHVFILKRSASGWRIDHVYRRTPSADALVQKLQSRYRTGARPGVTT